MLYGLFFLAEIIALILVLRWSLQNELSEKNEIFGLFAYRDTPGE